MPRKFRRHHFSAIALCLIIPFIFGHFSFQEESALYRLQIPEGFPDPPLNESNPLTEASVKLGKKLFYEFALSRDSSLNCAVCHRPGLAFTDGLPKSRGMNDMEVTRNSPTLANVVYQTGGLLHDKGVPTLEMQVLVPVQEHKEFDFDLKLIAERLKKDEEYVRLSKEAYNQEPSPYVITRAIANFQRTLISGNSPYDQFIHGNEDALTDQEKKGMDLFFNKLHCSECHSGFLFSDFSLKNNGLYPLPYPLDSGRMRITHREEDRDLFKVPTLRNIGETAPYMHDGSMETLEEVIAHYANGGFPHPNKSPLIKPFTLSVTDTEALIAFLHSLSDTTFLWNQEFRPGN